MLILGIESSCDETAIALVRDGKQVLVSLVTSQIEIHQKFGGVIPEIAAREHLNSIEPLFIKALDDANVSFQDVDAIAVSQGPGLIGSLLIGATFAKGLAQAHKRPLIPVNHVHAHIYGALLGVSNFEPENNEEYPSLALVVSGGHTNLYLMESITCFKLLANSVDDACGEAFDKVAKLFGMKYPGGPKIEKIANQNTLPLLKMPKMVSRKSDLFFSYSGLKTFVLNKWKSIADDEKEKLMPQLCASFQKAAFDQLIRKLQQAVTLHPNTKNIIVAGGVAANKYLANELTTHFSQKIFLPDLKYCSDNAAMIAAMAYYKAREQGISAFENNFSWQTYSRYQYLV